MNAQQYEEERKRRADLNAKQLALRERLLQLQGELDAARTQRISVKRQVAELDVRLQEYERDNRVSRPAPKRERPRPVPPAAPLAAAAPSHPWWKFWKR